jgi:hypothetical protein
MPPWPSASSNNSVQYRYVEPRLSEQYTTPDAEFAEVPRELGAVGEQKMKSQGRD